MAEATSDKPLTRAEVIAQAQTVTGNALKAKTALAGTKKGGYVATLIGLLKSGISTADIGQGYVAARVADFAGRPAYKGKDGPHVVNDCRKHAANHITLALATQVRKSQVA
jgi:hypothetical protein